MTTDEIENIVISMCKILWSLYRVEWYMVIRDHLFKTSRINLKLISNDFPTTCREETDLVESNQRMINYTIPHKWDNGHNVG